jgi:hypothetical protein
VFTKSFDFHKVEQGLKGRFSLGRSLTGDFLRALPTQPSPTVKSVAQSELVGQPLDVVNSRLAAAGVTVTNVEKYDPTAAGTNLLRVAGSPTRVTEGKTVTLYTDEKGVVRYYSTAGTVRGAVAAERETAGAPRSRRATKAEKQERAALMAVLETLRADIDRMQKESAQAIAERDRLIAALRTDVDRLASPKPPRKRRGGG